GRPRGVCPVEPVEHPLRVWRASTCLVRDRGDHSTARLRLGRYPDRRIFRRVLDGIVEEVLQDLVQPVRVRLHGRQSRGRGELQYQSASFGTCSDDLYLLVELNA